jgi:hypothetical protein
VGGTLGGAPAGCRAAVEAAAFEPLPDDDPEDAEPDDPELEDAGGRAAAAPRPPAAIAPLDPCGDVSPAAFSAAALSAAAFSAAAFCVAALSAAAFSLAALSAAASSGERFNPRRSSRGTFFLGGTASVAGTAPGAD